MSDDPNASEYQSLKPPAWENFWVIIVGVLAMGPTKYPKRAT